jgi:hypothetical protein
MTMMLPVLRPILGHRVGQGVLHQELDVAVDGQVQVGALVGRGIGAASNGTICSMPRTDRPASRSL